MELPDSHPAIVIYMYDAFRGHDGEELRILLSESHLISVRVPNNCTDRLQPLDLSVNKAIKDRLRQPFTDWYACQVKLQIESGKSIKDLRVDTRLSMKEPEAKWIVSVYDYMYLRSNPSISINGFKAAGILDAREEKIIPVDTAPSDDEDPFADLTDDDSD